MKNIGLIYEKRGRYAEQNGDLDQRDIWYDKAAEVWSKAVRLGIKNIVVPKLEVELNNNFQNLINIKEISNIKEAVDYSLSK